MTNINQEEASFGEVKSQIMSQIILASQLEGERPVLLDSDEDYEDLPFTYKVLSTKLQVFEVSTEFTHSAALLLSLYAENNPGAVQLYAAQCIESNPIKVDIDVVIDRWSDEMPNPGDMEYSDLWDLQKVGTANAVDDPKFWSALATGKSVEEVINELKENSL